MLKFLSEKKSTTPPVLVDALLNVIDSEQGSLYQARFERHFNYWVNGPDERRESGLGRFAVRQLWQTCRDPNKIAMLDDNVNYVKESLKHLNNENKAEHVDYIRESLRVAYIYGAENVVQFLDEIIEALSIDNVSVNEEVALLSIVASDNFEWLMREIDDRGLDGVPDILFRNVNLEGYSKLNQIAKELFDIDPPVVLSKK